MDTPSALRIGIDIGGTFTDFVVFDPDTGHLETFKLLSTPHDPAQAVLQGLERILPQQPRPVEVIHGSTVATNALLERKGARVALVTTAGFTDVIEIGRQNRPQLYDFFADPPPPLAPAELRFGLHERLDERGRVLQALDEAELEPLVARLRQAQVQAIAVCLLFSFANPQHEQLTAARLRQEGWLVSVSHEVLPEFREYERTSTTLVNAYVSPVLDGYLRRLESALSASADRQNPLHLRVMGSNGGSLSLEEARRSGVRCILSGPAGGIVGAQLIGELAQAADEHHGSEAPGLRLITFDMGGTSTDVALIDGQPQTTTEAVVGGCPIRLPLLDIHTIGAGGGSIARIDPGGALRVGPESAGADPGPACYGRGDLPTVTDANLVLGRLAAEHFLGGLMPLDVDRAHQALLRLGRPIGLNAEQAALGVLAVANAHMERALRVISVERGHDPRRFALLSFGGAGGLHAAALAPRLGIRQVIAPPLASTLSAFGMLAAAVVKDYSLTVMLPGETPLSELQSRLEPLAQRGREELLAEGVLPADIRLEQLIDVRYAGQSFELSVPFGPDYPAQFHQRHAQVYGYARPNAPLELVNLRVRAVGHVPAPQLSPQAIGDPDPAPALLEYRPVIFSAGTQRVPFYRFEALQPGNRLRGPAAIVRTDTTIFLEPGDTAEVDPYLNLRIAVSQTR